MMNGAFPKDFQSIGVEPEDMKTSSHFSDLLLGESGTLYIKGNKKIGVNSIIRLKPISTLGGVSLEWQCDINVRLSTIPFCEYEKGLKIYKAKQN